MDYAKKIAIRDARIQSLETQLSAAKRENELLRHENERLRKTISEDRDKLKEQEERLRNIETEFAIGVEQNAEIALKYHDAVAAAQKIRDIYETEFKTFMKKYTK